MRALVCREYGPPEALVLEERPDPEPGAGQVLVEVRAAAINFFDLLAIAGRYQVRTPPPFVAGHEAAGTVAALGEGVTGLAVGDPVIIAPAGGAFAERCLAARSQVFALPRGLDYEQGAGLTITYGTGYHALRQGAELRAGETVLVLGAAGGAGSAAVELAKAMRARVIAAASGAEKLEFARRVGADETLDYGRSPLREAVKALTGGAGVDVVYDPVGGELAEQALRATAWHGRYLVIGFASGTIPRLPANLALLKEARIVGIWWGTWAERHPEEQAANMAALTRMVEQGRLAPRVGERYPLERYRDAFRAISERRARGKVVLQMG